MTFLNILIILVRMDQLPIKKEWVLIDNDLDKTEDPDQDQDEIIKETTLSIVNNIINTVIQKIVAGQTIKIVEEQTIKIVAEQTKDEEVIQKIRFILFKKYQNNENDTVNNIMHILSTTLITSYIVALFLVNVQ